MRSPTVTTLTLVAGVVVGFLLTFLEGSFFAGSASGAAAGFSTVVVVSTAGAGVITFFSFVTPAFLFLFLDIFDKYLSVKNL